MKKNAIIFMIMNRHASKLFKNILHDVQTEDNVEKITNMKICILILCMGNGFLDFTTVFYNQRL